MKKYVVIYATDAGYSTSSDHVQWPAVEFKLKNIGTRTLKGVEVTVCFYDGSGRQVAEEKYFPVRESTKPLKPGFIWQIENGKFYAAKSVPSEWKGGAKFTVTDITFAAP